MNIRQLGIFAILISFVIIGSSSKPDSNTILWSEDRPLTWDDFQGRPDYNYDAVSALTSSGIMHMKGCENGKIIYKIEAYFEKDFSWVKPEAYTDHHLEHEQIHFDITQLYAKKLEHALDKQHFQCGEEEEFEQFVQEFLAGWQKAQINFDLYTHYSMKPPEQYEWKHKVALELSVFKDL